MIPGGGGTPHIKEVGMLVGNFGGGDARRKWTLHEIKVLEINAT